MMQVIRIARSALSWWLTGLAELYGDIALMMRSTAEVIDPNGFTAEDYASAQAIIEMANRVPADPVTWYDGTGLDDGRD